MDSTPPRSALLVIDDLAVAYPGGTRVLDNLSLSLERGEIGCLVGSSGCGKTTLLRAIAGFLPVAAGTIEIDGLVVAGPHFTARFHAVLRARALSRFTSLSAARRRDFSCQISIATTATTMAYEPQT